VADRRKTEFLATLAHGVKKPAGATASLTIVRLQTDRSGAGPPDAGWVPVKPDVVGWSMACLTLHGSGGQQLRQKELGGTQGGVSVAIETSQPHIQDKHHALRVQMPEKRWCLRKPDRRASHRSSLNLLNKYAAKYTWRRRIELSVAP
jgi:hypothetical protein